MHCHQRQWQLGHAARGLSTCCPAPVLLQQKRPSQSCTPVRAVVNRTKRPPLCRAGCLQKVGSKDSFNTRPRVSIKVWREVEVVGVVCGGAAAAGNGVSRRLLRLVIPNVGRRTAFSDHGGGSSSTVAAQVALSWAEDGPDRAWRAQQCPGPIPRSCRALCKVWCGVCDASGTACREQSPRCRVAVKRRRAPAVN